MTIGHKLYAPFYGGCNPLSSDRKCSNSNLLSTTQAAPRLLACSIDGVQQKLLALRDLDRKLCEDRKTAFEHLTPGSLAKSTFRIVVTQGSIILSSYANDQLHQDMKRDKLVEQGKMTPAEAEEASEEWETREWKIRWETYPSKVTDALVKYHLIVLVMRLYESIAAKLVDSFTLDSLTLDTFKVARRLHAKEENKVEVGKEMFQICGQASLIAFLADYSVHQVIIGWGYYTYIRDRRRKQQLKLTSKHNTAGTTGSSGGKNDEDNKEEEGDFQIVKKSATLALSRGLGLMFTAVGGGFGSMLLPGWGTMLGSNLGDSIGGAVSDGAVVALSA